jgi:pimeloyl-ACP methyl ester carboxylesterase
VDDFAQYPDNMTDGDVFRLPVGPGNIHAERFGFGGTPFLLIHGFATSSFLWRHVGPLLATRKSTAFALDLLGYGESDRPIAADFGITAQASYIDLALTALRVSSVVLVGVDLGATVALRVAYDRPERVERLVLISPPKLESFPPREIRDLQQASGRYAFALNRSLLGAMPLFSEFLEASVADRARMPETLVGRYLAPFVGRDGLSHLQTLARSLEDEELDDLDPKEIPQPALIIRGSEDRFCTREDADALVAALPLGRYVELEGVARLVPEESPQLLVDALLAGTGESAGSVTPDASAVG